MVEDDKNLREITVKLLQDGGYRVIEAKDAEEALRIMAASQPAIDLLLTDVIMPGKSGPELANRPGKAILSFARCSCRDTPAIWLVDTE